MHCENKRPDLNCFRLNQKVLICTFKVLFNRCPFLTICRLVYFLIQPRDKWIITSHFQHYLNPKITILSRFFVEGRLSIYGEVPSKSFGPLTFNLLSFQFNSLGPSTFTYDRSLWTWPHFQSFTSLVNICSVWEDSLGRRIETSSGHCSSVDSKSRSPNRSSHRFDPSRKEYYSTVSTTKSSLATRPHQSALLSARISCCEIESLTVHALLSTTLQSIITLTYYVILMTFSYYVMMSCQIILKASF